MRLWLTKDEEGLCLWRTRPILGGDGVWWEENEDFDEITEDVYYSLTGYGDLPRNDGLIEIDVSLVPPSIRQSESDKYVKVRKHK